MQDEIENQDNTEESKVQDQNEGPNKENNASKIEYEEVKDEILNDSY